MAGTFRIVDDEVPISVEGLFRIVENQMPVGSVVTFFLNYWTKNKIFIIISRFHPAYWHTIKWGSRLEGRRRRALQLVNLYIN